MIKGRVGIIVGGRAKTDVHIFILKKYTFLFIVMISVLSLLGYLFKGHKIPQEDYEGEK